MITDFLALGGVPVANSAQMRAFLANGQSPIELPGGGCGCDTITPEILGEDPWTTPDDPANPADWYDPAVPESADFYGLLLLSVEGTQTSPRSRTVSNLIRGGGVFGSAVVRPRTLTFTGLLLGASCCAVTYGYEWLAQALQGCNGSSCGDDCATMYDCCPAEDATPAEWNAQHRRTYRRVALTSGPEVVQQEGGGGCSTTASCSGADVLTVEFTLTAATPYAYGDELELMSVALPIDTADCVAWCVHNAAGDCDNCRFAGCPSATSDAADPAYAVAPPPQAVAPDSAYCDALSTVGACYDVDLSQRPQWIDDVPMITVYAGGAAIRNMTVSMYKKTSADAALTCDEIAANKRCTPDARWEIQYMPPGSMLTLDGQVDKALISVRGICSPSNTVFGDGGTTISWPVLDCAGYCLCIETNSIIPPAPDAELSFSVSGRHL